MLGWLDARKSCEQHAKIFDIPCIPLFAREARVRRRRKIGIQWWDLIFESIPKYTYLLSNLTKFGLNWLKRRARVIEVFYIIKVSQKPINFYFNWLIPLCSIKEIFNDILKQFSILQNILKYFFDKCFLIFYSAFNNLYSAAHLFWFAKISCKKITLQIKGVFWMDGSGS